MYIIFIYTHIFNNILYNIVIMITYAPLCRSTQERKVTVTATNKVIKVTTTEVAVEISKKVE